MNVDKITIAVSKTEDEIRKRCEFYLGKLGNQINKSKKYKNYFDMQMFALQALNKKWAGNEINFEVDLQALQLIGC